jgi:ligand-binding sensor domain-containing protein
MRYGLVTAIFFISIGLFNPVVAQQPIFKNYTVNDGLISNSIRRVFQDSKGFLWIATWEGLSKYDGHMFTSFSTTNGLSHNLVNDFYESKEGQISVALNNGSIDIITGNTVIQNVITPIVVVNKFIINSGHPVIVTTDRSGLQEFRDGKFIQPKQSFSTKTYLDLLWLNDSLFVAVSDSSIGVYNRQYELFSNANEIVYDYTGTKIFSDSKKRIWAGTNAGLRLLAGIPHKGNPISFSPLPSFFNIPELQHRKIIDILEDKEGNMWFATSEGLVKITPDGLHQTMTVKDGLASNIVTSIFQDRENNIWFGTAVGLSKLVTKSAIHLYPIENGVWSSDNIYLLSSVKKNHLLVSTQKAVKLFNKKTGVFSSIANVKNDFFYAAVPNSQPPILFGFYKMAFFDTLNLQLGKISSLPLTKISRIVQDRQGNFFMGTLNELLFYSGKQIQKILEDRISSLLIDKQGYLWVGTWLNGLYRIRYIFINNRFQLISKEAFLPKENIRSLFEDSKGDIWVGTRYQGVYRLMKNEKQGMTISNFNQSKGLSSNFIKGIREDAKGNFWIAFYQGIDKLIPSDSGFHIFNFSRVNNFFASVIGIEIAEDHTLWLATGEGLVHIADGEIEKLPPLPVYITKVSSPDSIYNMNATSIELNYRQNQIQFEFSSPGFINEKQVLYSYRLSESNETEWTAPSNQHMVSFASLKPGNYLFEVRTIGWNDNWGEPTAFKFIISPPFWQSGWFIIMCLLITTSIIYLLIRIRIKGIKREAQMKQKIAETEMMALRAQMNPHFIFNCLNSIDNLIQMNEKEKATLYLSKFAKLIRSILENAANNVVPCWKDMDTLQLYLELEALRFDNKFSYQVIIADEILNGDYKVPPLVIQPFVENALHHGLLNKITGDKKLLVTVSVTNNHILYRIEDNGIGRTKAASYKQLNKPSNLSMGMQITADRINLFNQQNNESVKITDLYDSHQQAEGTAVEVKLVIQS